MLTLKIAYRNFVLLCLLCAPVYLCGANDLQPLGRVDTNGNEAINPPIDSINKSKKLRIGKKHKQLSYYLNINDFVQSFIEIPTSNVSGDSSTISSQYLAGRAPLYDRTGAKVGTCSASFLCMQNQDGIYTDISNYLSVDNGLVISWFTPTTLLNLELDSIVHSMVTECIVLANTKVGFNPFYGKEFNMVVSSDDQKIYFVLTKI